MIKTLLAYTSEIVSPEIAASEIREQIGIPDNLLSNSVAIITCYPEFAEFGLVEEISKMLPFPSVGCTTYGNAVKDNYGFLAPLLTVTVLTSDDVQFVTVLSSDLTCDKDKPFIDKNELLRLGHENDPALILSFASHGSGFGGSSIVERLNSTFENIPIFGTFACDPNVNLLGSNIFYNGSLYSTRNAFIIIYGNIDPSFFVLSISEDVKRHQKAVITSSADCILKEVNGQPFLEYLKGIGITDDCGLDALITIPFIIDFEDGTEPITRSIISVNDEGYAVCGGNIPQDQTLSICSFEADDIIKSTELIVRKILETQKTNGLIIFSCLTRNLILGHDMVAEVAKIYEIIGDKIPYHMSYAGGEMCPAVNFKGKFVNRLHNCSIIACVF